MIIKNLFLNSCQHFCLVYNENRVGKVSAADFGLYKQALNGNYQWQAIELAVSIIC